MEPAGQPEIKWYLKPGWVIAAIFVAGPFALGLVWKSPAIKKEYKIWITVAVVVMTLWMIKASADLAETIAKYMQEIQSIQ